MKTNIDQCIKCSLCNAYCPVFQATGLFPGPKLSGPDAERFRLKGKSLPGDWLEYCDYCKICSRVCPHNVPIPELHMRALLSLRKKQKPSFRNWLLGHSYLLEKLGRLGTPVSNWINTWAFFRWLLDRGLGIDRRVKMPAFNSWTFTSWFRSRPSKTGEPIAYFHGCYTNYIDPALGRDVVEVLEKNGFQVFLPRQECCGLPLISNGFFDLAVSLAKKNLSSLQAKVGEGLEVIFSSPSCGMTLKEEYDSLLNIPGAALLADHLLEISQFLLYQHGQGKLNARLNPLNETLYYHVPCHLRALKLGLPALELLSLIPGLKVIELPEGCCGLAGTFGLKKEKYSVAKEVGEELFQAVRDLKAAVVISECEACRLQIAQHTGVRTLHPVQVLRRAYGE